LFNQQPSRTFVFSFVLGCGSIELFKHYKTGDIERTDRVSLSFHNSSPGFKILVRLLNSTFHVLDFSPPITPSEFKAPHPNKGTIKPLFPLCNSNSTSAVYLAKYNNKKCVLKFSWLNYEARFLKSLHEKLDDKFKNIPSICIASATPSELNLIDYPFMLITEPYGRLLSNSDTVQDVTQVLYDVSLTAIEAAKINILHRDISINNIVVVEKKKRKRGMLIDWMEAGSPSNMTKLIIGTKAFFAISLMRGEPHSIECDLESIFYSLIYLATDGRLSWSHGSIEQSYHHKWTAMTHPVTFEKKSYESLFK